MDVPLTLGMPPRERGSGLLAGLFDAAEATFAVPLTADAVATLIAAGTRPGLTMTEPLDAVADSLAVLAHSSVGFVAAAEGADEVLAVLCATVAALCGDDVRSALTVPDVATLAALHPDAVAAVREVLVAVRVADPTATETALRSRGVG